jgi:ACS family hexuronate transporter-like MFS transporter
MRRVFLDNDQFGNYRWFILALLFAATTINYIDRIVISVLIPEIKSELNINDINYGLILSAFQLTYTLGFLVAGKFIDWIGTKLGYLLFILFWSVASGIHGLCKTAWCLSTWRGVFGLTASGNFPAAIKSVSEWFPIKERSFATSLFNSGSSISSIIGPPLIAAIFYFAGWRWTFVVFGSMGLILVGFWQFLYKKPPNLLENENKTAEKIPYTWKKLFQHRETYGIMIGKFLTDPVWWFYLFWMPNYLNTERGFDLKEIAIAIPTIYIIAILLGLIGGWFPGYLMRKGWSVLSARKLTMLFTALALPISATAVWANNPWMAVILVSLACGAHNGWSANIFTLSSDCFPSRAVASMTGLAGFAGGLGGFIIATMAPGYIVTYLGYTPIFILMGVLHPLAYIFVHFFIREVSLE